LKRNTRRANSRATIHAAVDTGETIKREAIGFFREDYIKTTFPMTTPGFKDSMPNLLATKDSVFHEPYVGARLPFRVSVDTPQVQALRSPTESL
jgi:hypothetical protein